MPATTKNNHSLSGADALKSVPAQSPLRKEIGIQRKLLAICVLLVSIPTVFLGTLGYNIFKLHAQRNTEVLMRKIVLDWCQVTDSYVKQVDRVLRREEALVKQRLKAIVKASSLVLSFAAKTEPSESFGEKELARLKAELSQVEIGRSGYVFIADGQGRCLYAKDKAWQNSNVTSFLSPDNSTPPESFLDYVKDFSREEGDVFAFSTPDPETAKARKQIAAVIYFEPWDLIIGALTYLTDFKSHALEKQLQDELRYRMADQRIGGSGYIWVVNSQGDYIVSLDRMRDGENILHHQDDNGILFIKKMIEDAKILKPGGTTIQYYFWQNLHETQPAKKMAASAYVPEWDWIIGASNYEIDYFKGFERIRLMLIIFCLLTIIMGSLVGYFFASRISKPIKTLNRLCLKAANGEFDVKIQEVITAKSDEIGGLARSFETMIQNLKILLDEKETFSEELLIKNKELGSAKKSLENALFESEQLAFKAQEASRAKSIFLATMSHELRTPLSAILGYAQMLIAQNPDEATEKRLKIILQSGEHLLTIICDVLDIAKIEAQVLELDPHVFNFPNFLENLALMVELQAREKAITLVRNFDSALPRDVEADEKRLKQILINLLNNAVKFTEKGEIFFEVQTIPGKNILDNQSRVLFSVEDTGIGISEQDLDLIFLPFKQLGEGTNLIKGTGLGLPISKEIVEKMGGKLTVSSTLQRGSRFSFILDLNMKSSIIGRSPHQKEHSESRKDLNVLVVDDIDINRDLFCDMLEFFDVAFREADGGNKALQLVEEQLPDIVLLDLNMPDMHGYDVLKKLRQTYGTNGPKIVIVTGNANPEEEERCMAAGADGFLTKPFTLDKLQSIIYEA